MALEGAQGVCGEGSGPKGGSTAAASDPRGRMAAWVCAGVLLGVCAAKWGGFVYPNYLGAVVFQCGALAALLVWAWPGRLPAAGGGRPGAAGYFFSGYAVLCAATWLWAPTRRLAAIGSLPVLFGVGWALGLGGLLSEGRAVRTVLRAMFAAGTLAAAVGVAYVWRGGGGDPIEGVQGHRNFLAIFLLAPLVVGVGDLLTPLLTCPRERGAALQLPVAVIVPCVLVMLTGFALCKSWGALVGLGTGVTCVFAARLSRRGRWAVAAAFVVVVVAAVAGLSLPAAREALLRSPQATRWFMWQGAVRMIMDRPVFGWGTGMFMLHFADYKPVEPMRYGWLTSVTLYPHNELLLVAVEGGIAALALYLGGHFFAVRGYLRKGREGGGAEWVAACGVFGGFLAMFMHGLVEVSLRYWAPAAAYWTLLGVMIAAGRGRGDERRRAPGAGGAGAWIIFAGAVGLVAVASWGVVRNGAKAEWLMGGASREAGNAERIRNYVEAMRLSRYVPDYMLASYRRAGALQEVGDVDGAIAAYEEIARTAPGYGPVRRVLAELHYGRAREIGGRDQEAGKAELARAAGWLERAVRQNPYEPEARLLYARVMLLASRRNLPAALEHARAAAEAAPGNGEARYLFGALLMESGRLEEARAELEKAAGLCGGSGDLARRVQALRAEIEAKAPRRD